MVHYSRVDLQSHHQMSNDKILNQKLKTLKYIYSYSKVVVTSFNYCFMYKFNKGELLESN